MAKEHVDLVITKASELLTLRGHSRKPATRTLMSELGIVNAGAIAINHGRIAAVDKTPRIEQRFTGETTIDASRKVVMPGFVDAHTHLVFAGAREDEFQLRLQGHSYLDILAKGGGILTTVRATRHAPKEELITHAKETLDIMLEHGSTTVEAKSGYGLTTADEIKCLEAAKTLDTQHPVDVVSTFLGAHALPPEYANRTDHYVRVVTDEMIPHVAGQRLAEFCDVFCEHGAFNIAQSRKILQAGVQAGLKTKIHADELSQLGGAELAAELHATSADHLLFASEHGLNEMASAGVVATLLPTASFALMNGRYAAARTMMQLGVPIAFGTDFNPNCWTENMQLPIAFACMEMGLLPAEAITAATINAAHAVHRAADVGSLEAGKKADLIILNIPNHKFLGYRFGVNLVEKVVKAGSLVVDKGAP